MSHLNIAIIGAGPAGCALGRLLHLKSIRFTIFESEISFDIRSQGGTLDLHAKTGIAALKKAQLYEEFLEKARFDGEAMIVADKKFVKYLSLSGSKDGKLSRGRPEIDRPQLRQILLDSLPAECIRWGKRLERVETDPSLQLHFRDGTAESGFDLVVGADGAWSKVRCLLTNVLPEFSGVAGYGASIPDAAQREPELYTTVNRGSLFSFSDGMAVMGQQMGDGSLWVSFSQTGEEIPAQTLTAAEGKALKETLNNRLADWSPTLKDIILHAEDSSFSARSLYMLPIGTSWTHRAGVTCIGDAAHLMTPFAGEGVNLALADTMYLADAIVAANTAISAANDAPVETASILSRHVATFEAGMFKRCTPVQQQTADMMTAMFMTPGAPRTSIERWVLAGGREQVPRWAMPLASGAVHAYYFAFKLFR